MKIRTSWTCSVLFFFRCLWAVVLAQRQTEHTLAYRKYKLHLSYSPEELPVHFTDSRVTNQKIYCGERSSPNFVVCVAQET